MLTEKQAKILVAIEDLMSDSSAESLRFSEYYKKDFDIDNAYAHKTHLRAQSVIKHIKTNFDGMQKLLNELIETKS